MKSLAQRFLAKMGLALVLKSQRQELGVLSWLKSLAQRFLEQTGFALVLISQRQELRELARLVSTDNFRNLLLELPPEQILSIAPYLRMSKSQLAQDLFVLAELSAKKHGFFVEFGATDGITLSNTWLLEKSLAWQGIVCEPAQCWHERLAACRKCIIDTRCVWKTSGEMLPFFEAPHTVGAELSSIKGKGYYPKGVLPGATGERAGIEYRVETVSLTDLLDHYQAPPLIDFLSIDTEGSEYDILSAHNFNKYRFRIIAVEHNARPIRHSIFNLLTSHGYKRKYEHASAWDDWYILEPAMQQVEGKQ